MNEQISKNIKILNFIMTLFLVCYHIRLGSVGSAIASFSDFNSILNTEVNYLVRQMGSFVMSYFFAVSGFLLFYNLSHKNYYDKIKRRFFSLMIPYISWQVISVLLIFLCSGRVYTISDFFIRTFGMARFPLNGPLWYIYAIFIMALFSPILLLIFKNKNIGCIIMLCIIIVTQKAVYEHFPLVSDAFNYGFISNIVDYLPSYLMGAFCGKFINDIKLMGIARYMLLVSFVCFLTVRVGYSFGNFIIRLMPLALLFLFPFTEKLKDKKIYHLSFLIYAMHQPFLKYFANDILYLLRKIDMPTSLFNIIGRGTILLLLILMAFVIYTVMKKYTPKILNVLTGGRA